MTRVLQISDTHLSRAKPHFMTNWRPLREWAAQQDAAFVIHTGDLSVDGADVEEDLRDGAAMMRELALAVLAVPGNHDVGEAGHPHQPIGAERLARWRRHFGADRWSRDVEDWRLIGFDSMLLGNDDGEERAQDEWLRDAMATADGRTIAWFTHRPLFIDSPDEGDTGYWSVKPKPRAALLELADSHDVALIASGHLHKWRDHRLDGRRYVWCAASSFVVGPVNQPEMGGEKRLGATVYDFHGAEVTVAHADVPGLTVLWIDDVLHEVYPPRRAS